MKLNLNTGSILVISALLLCFGCKKEYETIEELDEKNIEEYIRANNLQIETSGGVRYQIIKQGTGADLKYKEVVPVIFTVKSLDGQYVSADTFSTGNRYGAFGANTYYAGVVASDFLGYFGSEKRYPAALKTAVVEILKKRGGEIRVIVPSREAYGRNGLGTIPGNASLDYSIKVLNENDIVAYDDQSINKYMQANGLTGFSSRKINVRNPDRASTTDSVEATLYYKINDAGSGSPITTDSTITAEYTGKFFNGQVFDQATSSNPASFLLSNVIPGWQKSIPMIKGGGSIRLLIPSTLAYGFAGSRNDYGAVTIPTASCLDFEVKVTDVAP